AAWIWLVGGRHQLPGFAEPGRHAREIRRIAHRIVKSLPAGKWLGRTLEALRREQRRPQAVARGIADAHALGRPAQAFAEPCGLRGGGAECGHEVPLIEPEQLAGSGGGAEHAAGRGDVPALVVVVWRDRKPDTGLHLVAED